MISLDAHLPVPARVHRICSEEGTTLAAIGIDSHKRSLAACAVDELGSPLAERTFANDPDGHPLAACCDA